MTALHQVNNAFLSARVKMPSSTKNLRNQFAPAPFWTQRGCQGARDGNCMGDRSGHALS
jgi:hypothetical protein